MVYNDQTKVKNGLPKFSMVHYSLQYISTQPNMRDINNVTDSFYQGLCSITMFMKGYAALQQWSSIMLHYNNPRDVTH